MLILFRQREAHQSRLGRSWLDRDQSVWVMSRPQAARSRWNRPWAWSEAAALRLRLACRFSLEIAPEKHDGKHHEYRNHRRRNQNRIDGHSEPPLMSRHYADWLNAIFDADQNC